MIPVNTFCENTHITCGNAATDTALVAFAVVDLLPAVTLIKRQHAAIGAHALEPAGGGKAILYRFHFVSMTRWCTA